LTDKSHPGAGAFILRTFSVTPEPAWSVARICAEAEASRGLIAHYFASKEELLLAALHGLFDDAQARKQAIASDTGLDAVERIRRIAHSSFQAPVYSWEIAATNAAIGLFILIDGLWNSLATGKDDLQTAQAMALCDTYIEGCLRQN